MFAFIQRSDITIISFKRKCCEGFDTEEGDPPFNPSPGIALWQEVQWPQYKSQLNFDHFCQNPKCKCSRIFGCLWP